jgi:Inhibitor of vertebrate lysozyme (Ivy)/Cobalamin-independent synthase, Catalytic domain
LVAGPHYDGQIGHRYFDTGRYKADLICQIECDSYLIEHDRTDAFREFLGNKQLGVGVVDVQAPNIETGEVIAERITAHPWLAAARRVVKRLCRRLEGWKLGRKELHPGVIIKGRESSAWKKAVSSAKVPKKEQFWVQDMDGPDSADIVTGAGGRELVVGNTCRPHDCYDNNLVFAIDLANKQIWALRQGRGQSPKAKQSIGGPDAEMQQLLLQELAKEFPD